MPFMAQSHLLGLDKRSTTMQLLCGQQKLTCWKSKAGIIYVRFWVHSNVSLYHSPDSHLLSGRANSLELIEPRSCLTLSAIVLPLIRLDSEPLELAKVLLIIGNIPNLLNHEAGSSRRPIAVREVFGRSRLQCLFPGLLGRRAIIGFVVSGASDSRLQLDRFPRLLFLRIEVLLCLIRAVVEVQNVTGNDLRLFEDDVLQAVWRDMGIRFLVEQSLRPPRVVTRDFKRSAHEGGTHDDTHARHFSGVPPLSIVRIIVRIG